jgi:hypothetical protein
MTRRLRRLMLFAAGAALVVACGTSGTSEVAASATPGTVTAGVSGTSVLGTIRATLDDTVRTWYVVSGQSQGRPYASGVWLDTESGRRVIAIGAFDTATPPLESFTWSAQGMPTSYGDYTGSTFLLNLSVAAETRRFTLIYPPETEPAAMYSSQATLASLDTTFAITSGTVIVTSVSMADGLASAKGTFGGTFSKLTGEGSISFTDGTFEASGVPDARTMSRSPR